MYYEWRWWKPLSRIEVATEPYQKLKFEILLHILKDKRVEYFQVKTRRTNL